jgi:hypothetical protein
LPVIGGSAAQASGKPHNGALRQMWRNHVAACRVMSFAFQGGLPMHGIIYLIGLVVVIMAILSFFGLH